MLDSCTSILPSLFTVVPTEMGAPLQTLFLLAPFALLLSFVHIPWPCAWWLSLVVVFLLFVFDVFMTSLMLARSFTLTLPAPVLAYLPV